jgi:hypothetical protein
LALAGQVLWYEVKITTMMQIWVNGRESFAWEATEGEANAVILEEVVEEPRFLYACEEAAGVLS